MRAFRMVFMVCAVVSALTAPRAATGDPLRLEEVLASSDRHFPLIDVARKDQRVAEAELLSAQGAFDPVVRTRIDGQPLGGYPGGRFDFVLEAPTPLWGTSFFSGYRASFGKFADYDGKLETNQYGELRVGFAMPLLRNGALDRRRATISRAELGVPTASTGVKQARLEVARAASFRYFEWVAAGQRLAVSKRLLELAEVRDLATAERVRSGELARIDRIDNQRLVISRRGSVISAERALQAAAIELSLYLRDGRGEPQRPDVSRLPPALPQPEAEAKAPSDERGVADLRAALRNRPEVERLRLSREQLRVERDLAKNQLLPSIDLQATVSQDFGPGSPTRSPTVLEGSVSLELPTLNRGARGRRQAAEEALLRLDAQARLVRDRIGAELSDLSSAMAAARQRIHIAQEEVRLAREIEEAERTRFALGEGTLLFVNLREQATVEAALREIDALLDYHRAQAAYRAALAAD